jgi:hypothetical protein
MVQMRKFNSKAFHTYLLKHSSMKLSSREAFLELQAEYLVLLYKAEHSKYDEGAIRRYRDAIIKQLLEEDRTFQKLHKQVTDDMDKQRAVVDRERRQALVAYLMARKLENERVVTSAPDAAVD